MTDTTAAPDQQPDPGPASAVPELPPVLATGPVAGYQPYPQVQHHTTFIGQPMYMAPAPKGKSVASMVLGLVAIVFGFTVILPIISLIVGIAGVRTEPAGKGMAVTGIVLSSLILAGWVIFWGVIIAIAVAGAGAAAVSSTTGY